MRKLIIIFFGVITIAALNGQNNSSVFFAGGNICETAPFKLVFYDEFNGTSLDLDKWKTYYPYGPNGSDSCSFCRTHSLPDKQTGKRCYN